MAVSIIVRNYKTTVTLYNIFELHSVIPIQLLCSKTVSLIIDKLSESHGHAPLVSPLLDDLYT